MLVERSPELITAVAVLIVPVFLTLMLRCYVRITRRSFGKDDCCLVVAGLLYAWQTYEMIQVALDGIGVHDALLADKPEKAMYALKHMFMIEISFTFCVLFIKLGIAYMLLRVAVNLVHLWLIRIVTATYVAVSLAVDFYVILQCSPVAANWDYSLLATGAGHCGPVDVVVDLTYLITAINIVTDWFYVGMPIVLLWSLQMNRKTKIVSMALLSLGFFTSICSIVRMGYTPGFSNPKDHLWYSAVIMVWTYAEGGVGMICANCSALRPLFTSLLSSASSKRGTPYPGNQYSRSQSGPSQNANRQVLNSFRTKKCRTAIDEMERGFRLEDIDIKSTEKGIDVPSKDDASDKRILTHST